MEQVFPELSIKSSESVYEVIRIDNDRFLVVEFDEGEVFYYIANVSDLKDIVKDADYVEGSEELIKQLKK